MPLKVDLCLVSSPEYSGVIKLSTISPLRSCMWRSNGSEAGGEASRGAKLEAVHTDGEPEAEARRENKEVHKRMQQCAHI